MITVTLSSLTDGNQKLLKEIKQMFQRDSLSETENTALLPLMYIILPIITYTFLFNFNNTNCVSRIYS